MVAAANDKDEDIFIISLRKGDLLNIYKTAIKYQNVVNLLPNLGFKAKEKLPNRCFRTFWEFLQVVPPGHHLKRYLSN